jgi:hypothetical protein
MFRLLAFPEAHWLTYKVDNSLPDNLRPTAVLK